MTGGMPRNGFVRREEADASEPRFHAGSEIVTKRTVALSSCFHDSCRFFFPRSREERGRDVATHCCGRLVYIVVLVLLRDATLWRVYVARGARVSPGSLEPRCRRWHSYVKSCTLVGSLESSGRFAGWAVVNARGEIARV